MTSEDWVDYLPVAYEILREPEFMCQKDLQESLDEIATEFVWLTEIVDEAHMLFADKSNKLKHMPQTPSLIQREQEKSRQTQKVVTAVEKKTAQDNNLTSRSFVPKQLPFGRVSLNHTAKSFTRLGIHSDKAPKAEGNRQSKIIIEKQRNHFSITKSSKLEESEKLSPANGEDKENNLPVKEISSKNSAGEPRKEAQVIAHNLSIINKKSDVAAKKSDVIAKKSDVIAKKSVVIIKKLDAATKNSAVIIKKPDIATKKSDIATKKSDVIAKKLAAATKKSDVIIKKSDVIIKKSDVIIKKPDVIAKKLEEKIKSVSELATTSEIVLKPRASKNSVKLEGVNKMAFDASKLDTSRNNFSSSKIVGSKMPSGNAALQQAQCIKSSSFKSLKQTTQNSNEQKKDVCKSKTAQKSTVESSSTHLYGQKTRGHLSAFSGKKTEVTQNFFGKENYHLAGNIRSKQCQHDPLNETITVVTEVFEIVGIDRSVRLKEFNVVKTKTAPISELIDPQANCVSVDSTFNRQCSSIDQGFYEEGTSESSDETLAISKNSTGDEFDNEFSKGNKLVLNASKQGMTQKANEVANEVNTAKASNESGVHSGRVQPTSFTNSTISKDEIVSENRHRANVMKTEIQKEPSTRNMSTEASVRSTKTSQRPIQVESESISEKKQLTEKGMSPKPKFSCNNNETSVEQKRQHFLGNENLGKELLRNAADLRKQTMEDLKKLREDKEQKIAEAREMRLRYEQEQKERLIKKFESKLILKEKLTEERGKEEMERQKQSFKKQADTDIQRKEEEDDRVNKLREQEKDRKKQEEERMRSNKEKGKAEQKQQIEEDGKSLEERWAEYEQKRKEAKLRFMQEREEKEKERELIRMEKEKKIAFERAEQERIERVKKEVRDRKIAEEQEKLKLMERERLQRQQERMQQRESQQIRVKMMANKLSNSPFKKPPATVTMSPTQTLNTVSSYKTMSYEITPVKKAIVSRASDNQENYNIEDKVSDDSTDDEEAPRKKIPEWATGIPLNTALIRQHMHPPDLERIFRFSIIEPPDLVLVFPNRRKIRYKIRTSSANWNSPPSSQH